MGLLLKLGVGLVRKVRFVLLSDNICDFNSIGIEFCLVELSFTSVFGCIESSAKETVFTLFKLSFKSSFFGRVVVKTMGGFADALK